MEGIGTTSSSKQSAHDRYMVDITETQSTEEVVWRVQTLVNHFPLHFPQRARFLVCRLLCVSYELNVTYVMYVRI